MKTVIGVIGLGDRGRDLLDTLLQMQDVQVAVLCDLNTALLEKANGMVEKASGRRAAETTSAAELLARPEIEAVVIATSWNSHVPLAIQAMRAGKYAAFEVGPAQNLEECWQLIHTYETTGVPCMMLENCDYGEKELAVLRMIRAGLFGEITHAEGGYKHDHRRSAGQLHGPGAERAWQNLRRNGDLYLTHELGPIMNYLNLNRGNRMMTLCSMASKARGLTLRYQETEESKNCPREFLMGDVITTMIRCAGGETILLTHDTCSPRPYSRGGVVQGTRGIWSEELQALHIEGRTETEKWDPQEPYLEEFRHPLWRDKEKYKEWHHGGMDYLMLRAFLYAVRCRLEPNIDVYDTATLLAIPVLTEQSIAMGSMPVPVPDFTGGRWICREAQPASLYSLDTVHEELFTGDWQP